MDWTKLPAHEAIERLRSGEKVGTEALRSILLESENEEVKYEAVCHSEITDELLELAKEDESYWIREAAVVRKNGLPIQWMRMSKSEKISEISKNRNIDPGTLKALSHSWDDDILRVVALHENTPHESIEFLEKDGDPLIIQALRERGLPYRYRLASWEERLSLLEEGNLSEEEIVEIWKSSNGYEREWVYWSPACTDKALNRLLEADPWDDGLIFAKTIPEEIRRFGADICAEEVRRNRLPEESYLHIAGCYGRQQFKIAIALSDYLPRDAGTVLEQSDDVYVRDALLAKELSFAETIRVKNFPYNIIEILNSESECLRLNKDDWRKLSRFNVRARDDRLGTGKVVEAALLGENTPEWLIEEITCDPGHHSRHFIDFRQLPSELRLAGDEHSRYSLLVNMDSIEPEITAILSRDKSAYMREIIEKFSIPQEGESGIPQDFQASEKPGEIKIAKIISLELGRANWDCEDIDDESEFREYTLPSVVVCVGLDSSGKECSIVKIDGQGYSRNYNDDDDYCFDYPPVVIESALPSTDELDSFISNKKDLLKWARPLTSESIARLIASSLRGEIELREGEWLSEGISFAKGWVGSIAIPSFYATTSGWSRVSGATYSDGHFRIGSEEGSSNRFLDNFCGYHEKA